MTAANTTPQNTTSSKTPSKNSNSKPSAHSPSHNAPPEIGPTDIATKWINTTQDLKKAFDAWSDLDLSIRKTKMLDGKTLKEIQPKTPEEKKREALYKEIKKKLKALSERD